MSQRQRAKKNRPAKKLLPALAAVQRDAKAKGLDKLTIREINAEIAAYRREKDGLYGQHRRITASIPERLYRAVKAAAEAEGLTLTWFLRLALRDRVNNADSKSPRLTKAISESTGRFKTGRYES